MSDSNSYDYIIVGSGFGGSVSAMRLSEKGYKVLVIEKGRRWKDKDFPESNWNLPKYLWVPWFNWFGFQKINVFSEVAILSGAGVGGGSLVYANTHMFPPDTFFNNPVWSHFRDWKTTLLPFYSKAKFMLGSSKYEKRNIEDEALRQVAIDMGKEHTYGGVDGVGVYFGDPNVEVDPYFKGLGPLRSGCLECAGCMVGCRENAKNTLEKNYIYFAEKFGATILPETEVLKIEHINGEYIVHTKRTGIHLNSNKRKFTSNGLVISAGVLGTAHLLFNQRDVLKTLPNLSKKLGDGLLTNSEQLVMVGNVKEKVNNGISISVVFEPDEKTHIEPCKYPDNSSFMYKILMFPAAGEGHPVVRATKSILKIFTNTAYIKMIFSKNLTKNSLVLLVMQDLDTSMRLLLKKGFYGTRLSIKNEGRNKAQAFIKTGQEVLMRYAKKLKGDAFNPTNEVFLNLTSTAHILGGCLMSKTADEGVVNDKFEVHNYPNMYILDGSIMPCNLGVNPSLTITALTEYAMSNIPQKQGNTIISLEKQMELVQ
ncbi:MAG: GMC oxidoreductase [Solirubrobacteraceae bacterium]